MACLSRTLIILFLTTPKGNSAELVASDGMPGDQIGNVWRSGTGSLFGVYGPENNLYKGAAYFFKSDETASGIIFQTAKLVASDRAERDYFGAAVALSGDLALIGAKFDDDRGTDSGSVYVFGNLNAAHGTVSETAKLTVSNGAAFDDFGGQLVLEGSTGLIGAMAREIGGSFNQGAAFLFRDLDSVSGRVTESATLAAADGAAGDNFGSAVSLSGNSALVGAYLDDDLGFASGSAYLFRDLDTASGMVHESAKLKPSDGTAGATFGTAACLSGSMALVAAIHDGDNGTQSGSAYIFRDLDTASGSIPESAKLLASDGAARDLFGGSVSLSGTNALVGASMDDDKGVSAGSVYLFQNLDTATGRVTESMKIVESDGTGYESFGRAVSLDGDSFTIASYAGSGMADGTGNAYTGSISALTTLDSGNANRTVEGISFDSRTDWIIGKTTDANSVLLGAYNLARVSADSMGVYIGMNAGSDHNILILEGSLTTNAVHIGALTGNVGNRLRLPNSANVDAVSFILGEHSSLEIQGDVTSADNLLGYLGDIELQVWDGSGLRRVNRLNHSDLILATFSGDYTNITAVPEPGIPLMVLGAILMAAPLRRRARKL